MKKFLIILLLALATCSSIEAIEDIEFIDFPDWLVKGFNIIKDYFNKAKKWLQENKLWDPIKEAAEKYGREYGMKACTKFLSEDPCKKIVDGIINTIKNLSD